MVSIRLNRSTVLRGTITILLLPILGACATIADVAAPIAPMQSPNPTASAPGLAPPITPLPASMSQLKRFNEVVKEATVIPGFFTVYEKEDKFFLEIKPEQMDQPFFFASNLSHGIGEQFLYGGLMGSRGTLGGSFIAYFHRIGNTIQLIARNTDYTAKDGSPEARAVEDSFSDSLLSSAPLASQPHVDRKSLLIEVNMLLLADIPGATTALERAFRQPYGFDFRNSSISRARAESDQTTFQVSAHYGLSRPILSSGSGNAPSLPTTLQDVRSMFLGFHYNFAKLPEAPMQPRKADPRIGYFATTRWDFTADLNLSPRVHYVQRWRLEKKDPDAPLSEPKQPIVYWLDKNIPERYRPAITSGILEWNKAFERIGFKDAIQVKVQPDNATWDTGDSRHASVRWMTNAQSAFGAIGPSQVDPRTGEILDADIGIDSVRSRNARNRRVEQIAAPTNSWWLNNGNSYLCMAGDYAANEAGFAMELLEARGDVAPDSPESEAFVLEDLKDVTMHEVGHTLGLRHNFRASTIYTQAQLADPVFTKKNGISGSVMEYNAYNIAEPGERQGAFSMSTLGPYDYWAIEYAYKPIPAQQEADELKKIASRGVESQLAYSTDIDAAESIDPEVNTTDIGQDTLNFAEKRLRLAHELWDRWQARPLKSGESYAILRRNMSRGLQQISQASTIAAKYVGGVTVLRDYAGSPRAPLNPVSAEKQRAALQMVSRGLFSSDSFRFKPEFMRRLAVDEFDRADIAEVGLAYGSTDYSLSSQVLKMQTTVLDQLMSEKIANRILESDLKLDDPKKAFTLSELYGTLTQVIWSELKTGKEVSSLRRNLQREHLTRLAGALIKPISGMPADARALQRQTAKELLTKLKTAERKSRLSNETKAHFAECANTLEEAIKAPMYRTGV
ncbi:MAG: zinc-dependent metalloprotease [Pseudomonadota bacterium]